jgi:DNA-binding MarR family transcriptional regulator
MTVAAAPRTETELAARLRRAVVRLSRQLRRQADSGLSPSLVSALGVAARRGPLTPSALADIEGVRRPTATRVIARLERQGLLSREADPADGRSCRVAVTARGQALLDENRSRQGAFLARTLSELGPGELATLDRALDVIERLLESAR